MKQSYFVISLDFELMWGVTGSKTIENYGNNIKGVREVIPKLLTLFNKYDIHATWAIVGFLFHPNKTSLLKSLPLKLPNYTNLKHSNYYYLKNNIIGENEWEDPFHWGYSLVNKIKQLSSQEIATHTYSHFFCLEDGQTIQEFEDDLLQACELADKEGIKFSSIVFPRNQLNQVYLKTCLQYGIKYYRGPQFGWLWSAKDNMESSKLKYKVLRFFDAYLNISGYCTYSLPTLYVNRAINIPGSYLLRPYSKRLNILEGLKLHRIKSAMTYAAKNSQVYHIWWHPHNFGNNISNNMLMLENILKHYKYLEKRYNMQSYSMDMLGKKIEQNENSVIGG